GSGTSTSGRRTAAVTTVTVDQGSSSTVAIPLQACTAPVVSPASLSLLSLGTAFSSTLTATGSDGPYTFSVSDGTLPPGLSLNSSTGVLSGTPSTRGTANFTIAATSNGGCAGTTTYAPVTLGVTLNGALATASDKGDGGTIGISAEAAGVTWTAT